MIKGMMTVTIKFEVIRRLSLLGKRNRGKQDRVRAGNKR